MEKFKKIMASVAKVAATIVGNRRLISSVASYALAGLAFLGIAMTGNAEQITESITGIAFGVGSIVSGTLALISYLKPKKIEDKTNQAT